MAPNEFQPARSLDEANERLRKLEQDLAAERARVKRMTPAATPEQEEEMRHVLASTDWVDGSALDRMIAELEAVDGHR